MKSRDDVNPKSLVVSSVLTTRLIRLAVLESVNTAVIIRGGYVQARTLSEEVHRAEEHI